MNHYLLRIMQPDGDPPPPDLFEPIMAAVAAFNTELRDSGSWVFVGALHPASAATVVRTRDNQVLLTDGPFVEAKEHVGGIVVIAAKDLDEALVWGRKLSQATTLPIEVRPIQG